MFEGSFRKISFMRNCKMLTAGFLKLDKKLSNNMRM